MGKANCKYIRQLVLLSFYPALSHPDSSTFNLISGLSEHMGTTGIGPHYHNQRGGEAINLFMSFCAIFYLLFWDVISIIWDENIVYFFNLEKKPVLDQ